ncbi:snapalysin family zinc-dependent metalloprotease [Amycolatopsis anabasis]|uniref:snapalysin family zinc-dependent metalloprotease n=1 Tax=Amycolatopsis anabasis TaxID=1840409 RepID=UPI00131B4DB0|nr:snapalysin family zinc-dependent metalloprotease [Amycolatopsis anabasis]
MLRRSMIGVLAGAAVLTLPLTAGVAAPAAAATALATTITFDDSQAAEFKSAVAQGVEVWNTSVKNVQLVRATPGARVNIRILADNGWPRATLGPVRPSGSVTVWMGRQAVQQGHNVIRIAAHELGHSLGLPDVKPGPCSSLMSGSSAGTSCTNPKPNAQEAARVEQNYRTGANEQHPDSGVLISDAA